MNPDKDGVTSMRTIETPEYSAAMTENAGCAVPRPVYAAAKGLAALLAPSAELGSLFVSEPLV